MFAVLRVDQEDDAMLLDPPDPVDLLIAHTHADEAVNLGARPPNRPVGSSCGDSGGGGGGGGRGRKGPLQKDEPLGRECPER